ncbi:hypothetical protein F8M41_008275 [Gigaspora margarita]|uniref:Uncharacterized protein n=1 Tax=Gigaspora margarita TaxID=4874 RepID=A0A8H4A4P6_GIGMA|nr:hypothetical protein F8M41_008275 [Gigaspora margarita]
MIQENAIQAKDVNLDRQSSDLSLEFDFVNMNIDDNSIECDNSESIESGLDEYDNTDEEINEMIFDALALSRAESKEISLAKNNNSQDRNTKSKINKHDKCIPSTLTEDSLLPSKKEAILVLQDLRISEGQLNSENSDNNKSDIENVENKRTSIINESNIGPGGVHFVFVNDPILESFVNKTLNDSILVEVNDSDKEIEEQENLVQKHKIN